MSHDLSTEQCHDYAERRAADEAARASAARYDEARRPTSADVKRAEALRELETAAAAVRRAYEALKAAGSHNDAHEAVLVGLAAEKLRDALR